MQDDWKRSLISELDKASVFCLGDFVLKSGQTSPIYIDLRQLISHPGLLRRSCGALWKVMEAAGLDYANICGVPYAAFPLAAGLSLDHDVPMLMRRKEAKAYGTKKLIEGHIVPGHKCLIVEDTVTSGDSIAETAEVLRAVGLEVTDAIVLVDRSQGAQEALAKVGVRLHSAVQMGDLMDFLVQEDRLTRPRADEIIRQLQAPPPPKASANGAPPKEANSAMGPADGFKSWDMDSRLALKTLHPATRRLLEVMKAKESNLCLAADFTETAKILDAARTLGPELCLLKLHADIVEDFSADFVRELKGLAEEHKFLVMEDRKFGDTGTTVERQVSGGPLRVAEWADLATVHAVPGEGVVRGLAKAAPALGLVLVAEMSGKGALTSPDFAKGAVELAAAFPESMVGFVAQRGLSGDGRLLTMTPGVRFGGGGDELAQQFSAPADVVQRGADLIIVGRGITHAKDPKAQAQDYRRLAWEAFTARVSTA